MLPFYLTLAAKLLILSLLALRREDGEAFGLALFLGLAMVLTGFVMRWM